MNLQELTRTKEIKWIAERAKVTDTETNRVHFEGRLPRRMADALIGHLRVTDEVDESLIPATASRGSHWAWTWAIGDRVYRVTDERGCIKVDAWNETQDDAQVLRQQIAELEAKIVREANRRFGNRTAEYKVGLARLQEQVK